MLEQRVTAKNAKATTNCVHLGESSRSGLTPFDMALWAGAGVGYASTLSRGNASPGRSGVAN